MDSARHGDGPASFDIIVADGFVLTELAAVVDVIRIANRVVAEDMFEWAYRSARGGPVASSSFATVETSALPERPDVTYAFIIGNSDPDCPDLSMGRQIDRYTVRGTQVFLLAEAASRYIHENRRDSATATTHWENSALLRERHGDFEAGNVIASETGAVVTCAGMGAAVDVALAVIARHVPAAVQATVADILLHEHVRAFDTPQTASDASRSRTGDPELDLCLDLMRANIDEPIPIGEFSRLLGISNRSLERRFKTYLDATPNGYYRQLRLNLANNLLRNTSMPIRDVALACGFTTGFSALYRQSFGMTPTDLRKKLRRVAP